MWLIVLSDQLPVEALVGHYPANKLMGRGLILKRPKPLTNQIETRFVLCGISLPFGKLSPTRG